MRTAEPVTKIILTYLLTYLFHGRVLLENPTGFQLDKKFSAFYGTRRFITAVTSAHNLCLSWASSMQSTRPHPTSWRFILILSSHLCLGLLSGFFLSDFPTITLYKPLLSPIRATCPAHLIIIDFITRTILCEEYRSSGSSLSYLLTPWCRVLLEKLTGLQLVKKFPTFLWNPKVHYRTQKRPPTVPILGQPNPVHIPTSHLLEIHPNIIHPSKPRSPQWSLSLRFPHQDPIRRPFLTHTRHMPSPSHSSRFYHAPH